MINMSVNEYLIGNAKARAQEVLDSFDRSLTIITGVVSIGPIALFVLSVLTDPYLSLVIPVFITTTVLVIRRVFTKFRNKLNNELLSVVKVSDGFVSDILGSEASLVMSILGSNDLRKWFYVLRALDGRNRDLLETLLSRELQGDLTTNDVGLARYLLAIRFSSDKLITSMLGRGLRIIVLGYSVLLFSIPAIAKSLQFLGIHWNVFFILLIQLLVLTAIMSLLRIARIEFGINAKTRVFLIISILSILLDIALLVKG